jgi:hypothetical protein
LAHLFNGQAGFSPANFNDTEGKFDEVASNDWTPWKLGTTEADFKKQVDSSLPGIIMDCGECHVGGGAMQYVPNPMNGSVPRVPLTDIDTTVFTGFDPDGDATDNAIEKGTYTGFNYFIDNYDVDGDGDREEVQYIDYKNTGAMEMDCFMCHLSGYKYDDRVATLRQGRIAAAAVIGAGIADNNTLPWNADQAVNEPQADYGTTVDYTKGITAGLIEVKDHSSSHHTGTLYTLTADFFATFNGVPDSSNCANCHFGQEYVDENTGQVEMRKQVDWKKRGDVWATNPAWDVHYTIGCVACHSPNASEVAADPADADYGQATSTKIGHDPAKGDVPYSSLWNKRDKSMKSCSDCHGGGESTVAPDPAAAHAGAGLTDTIVQRGTDGTATISHIDLIDCAGCHVRKLAHYSGGAMVDATGPDHFGRLADHDNPYLERDMYDNLFMSWYKDWTGQRQMIKSAALTTMFWRDKNDVSFDGNNDTRGGGMDAFLQTHVANISRKNGLTDADGEATPMSADGLITVAKVAAYKNAILDATNGLQAELGVSGKTVKPFLSFMGVPFQVNHNVSAANRAYGANGCTDCHAADAGFYNGTYQIAPDNLTVEAGAFAGVTTPFTKGNGSSDPTDFHPNVKDKAGVRTVAVNVRTDNGPRNVDKSELLYETTFKGRDATFKDTLTGGAIGFPTAAAAATNTKGWLLKIEVQEVATSTTVKTFTHANFKVAADFDALNGGSPTQADKVQFLIDQYDATSAVDRDTYYSIDMNTNSDGLQLTAANGYKIRIHPQSDVGPLKLGGEIWVAKPVVGTDGLSYATRAEWVAHLNSIGQPNSDIDTIGGSAATGGVMNVTQSASVELVAADAGNGFATYTWIIGNDWANALTGQTVQADLSGILGAVKVILMVQNSNTGTASYAYQTINVVAPLGAMTVAYDQATDYDAATNVATVSVTAPFTHTQLYIKWRDGRQTLLDDASTTLVPVDHKFIRNVKKLVKPGARDTWYYAYPIEVIAYNGEGVLAGKETVTVTIPFR